MGADDTDMNEDPCVLLKRLPEQEVRQTCEHLLWTEVEEKCVWRAGGLQRGLCAPLFLIEVWRFPEEEQERRCRARIYTKAQRLSNHSLSHKLFRYAGKVGTDQEKNK